MNTYQTLLETKQKHGAGYLVLVDPDKIEATKIPSFVEEATAAGVDGFLVGGSLLLANEMDLVIGAIKSHTTKPVVIFPGNTFQVSAVADALLFLVLISGRNPEYLIGNQVIAAPIIKRAKLEAISTGYMLIEAGKTTSAEFMSNTKPIPHNKPDIAVAHALAAELMGMKMLYLDAGSGADQTVSEAMIRSIAHYCALPMIIGGGIRTPDEAHKKVQAGASFIVTGTIIEQSSNHHILKDFAQAIHRS